MHFMNKLDSNYVCTRLLCPNCHIPRWKNVCDNDNDYDNNVYCCPIHVFNNPIQFLYLLQISLLYRPDPPAVTYKSLPLPPAPSQRDNGVLYLRLGPKIKQPQGLFVAQPAQIYTIISTRQYLYSLTCNYCLYLNFLLMYTLLGWKWKYLILSYLIYLRLFHQINPTCRPLIKPIWHSIAYLHRDWLMSIAAREFEPPWHLRK
jgi:hypothetical protein